MDVVFCLDDKNGMCFNGRRLSMDSEIRKHFVSYFGERVIRMNAYSKSQFDSTGFLVSENFLQLAAGTDVCFVENLGISPHLDKISRIYVYRFNRLYPSDLKIDVILDKYQREVVCEFRGSSHDKITLEVYHVS